MKASGTLPSACLELGLLPEGFPDFADLFMAFKLFLSFFVGTVSAASREVFFRFATFTSSCPKLSSFTLLAILSVPRRYLIVKDLGLEYALYMQPSRSSWLVPSGNLASPTNAQRKEKEV